MIKGVNRRIIEVADTGTEYFERALFFVKPEYSESNINSLQKEACGACEILEQGNNNSHFKLQRVAKKKQIYRLKWRYFFVMLVVSALLGALVTKLFF